MNLIFDTGGYQKFGTRKLMHLTYWKIVPFGQKRFSECDIELISKNLSESTCPVVIIETLPDPQDIRIDIRIVSFSCHEPRHVAHVS